MSHAIEFTIFRDCEHLSSDKAAHIFLRGVCGVDFGKSKALTENHTNKYYPIWCGKLTSISCLEPCSLNQMEALYSSGHFQGYASPLNLSSSVDSLDNPLNSKEGIVALGVVLGSSISLVALAFAFITYR